MEKPRTEAIECLLNILHEWLNTDEPIEVEWGERDVEKAKAELNNLKKYLNE